MQIKGEKYEMTIRGNVRAVVQPMQVVLQAVRELESGEISISEAVQKYEVKRVTVMNWLKRHSELYKNKPVRRLTTKNEKRIAVIKMTSGLMTRREVAEKYNVDMSTVSQWKKQYSCGEQTINKEELMPETARPSKEIQANSDKSVERQLKELHLKVYALETMIDIAEKEFNIEIRKKSGTKQ